MPVLVHDFRTCGAVQIVFHVNRYKKRSNFFYIHIFHFFVSFLLAVSLGNIFYFHMGKFKEA